MNLKKAAILPLEYFFKPNVARNKINKIDF